jgi:hypothetical protein
LSDATKRSALHAGRPSRPTNSLRVSKPIPSFLAGSRDSTNICPITSARATLATARAPGRMALRTQRVPSQAGPMLQKQDARSLASPATVASVHALLLHVRRGGENRKKGKWIGCHGRATSISDSRRRIPASCPFLEVPFRRQAGRPAGVRTPWLSISRRLDFVSNQPLGVTDEIPGQPCLRD